MMKQRTQNFALGLTALVFLALFLATFIFLYPAWQAGGRRIEVYFRHETGMAPLKIGSPVLLGDSLEVGRVRRVTVRELKDAPGEGPYRTVFVVEADVSKDVPLYGNCTITTNQPAIGGSGYVSITNVGTPNVPLTPPVRGEPPASMSAAVSALSRRLLADGGLLDHLTDAADPKVEGGLMYKVLASLDDVNAITRELRTQMSPAARSALVYKLHVILDDVNAATAALRSELVRGDEGALLAKVHLALAHLDEGLSEAAALLKENRPLIHESLASVQRSTHIAEQELLPALRAELDPTNPAATLGKIHLAMDRTNAALADVQTMTAEGKRLMALSRPTLEQILQNFLDTSAQVRTLTLELILNPAKLLYPPSPEREARLVAFRAASSFADAAAELDAAAGRLEALLKSAPPEGRLSPQDDQDLREVFDAVQASFQRFEHAEQILWDKLK
jgi:ABC-type transporter Mla subunit MlaD